MCPPARPKEMGMVTTSSIEMGMSTLLTIIFLSLSLVLYHFTTRCMYEYVERETGRRRCPLARPKEMSIASSSLEEMGMFSLITILLSPYNYTYVTTFILEEVGCPNPSHYSLSISLSLFIYISLQLCIYKNI